MNVTAVIVTRGDVDLVDIFASIWDAGINEIVVWDNSGQLVSEIPSIKIVGGYDYMVMGRYAAIEHATHDYIYVQDDDCIIPGPGIQQIVHPFVHKARFSHQALVANMPRDFRHDFYSDHCLVGFGACFHRSLPAKVFDHFYYAPDVDVAYAESSLMLRCCDIVFTGLVERVFVDVPYKNQPWAYDDGRMWRQPAHIDERMRMRELMQKVREGVT